MTTGAINQPEAVPEKKQVEVVEIVPQTIEDELKELKKEVARLNNVVGQFKKMYSNWANFKTQLGL
jgi:hypothetical protein